MKLGILGTGMIVREFLPWLAGPDCPFTVQALCSTQRSAPVADEMCEQYGIPQRTTNYFELLQWVDVIYLAVPNLQHYRYAKVALEAGKHVIEIQERLLLSLHLTVLLQILQMSCQIS